MPDFTVGKFTVFLKAITVEKSFSPSLPPIKIYELFYRDFMKADYDLKQYNPEIMTGIERIVNGLATINYFQPGNNTAIAKVIFKVK